MQAGEAVRTLGGRYELTEEIARGGMGVIWRGEDTLLGRPVAVKEMFPHGAADSDERARKRVLREARAAAALHHPGIVTVYDMREEDGESYIVMELLDAESLHDEVAANGPLEERRAIDVGRETASALRAAHEHGITHRDVKPRNVLLLDDGRVKLADFGISSIKDDPSLTATGEVIGSPAFMSPEQAQGGPASARTDLWGLGATLYYAVEGAPPFGEGEAIPTLRAVVHDPPRPMQRAGSLAPIVSALLEKDPALRPAEEDLPRLFDEAAAGTTPVADDSHTAPLLIPAIEATPTTQEATRAATPTVSNEPPRRRSWILAGAIAAAIALAAVVGLVAFGGNARAPAKSGKSHSATLADHPVTKKHSAQPTVAATTPAPAPTTEAPPPADTHGAGNGGPNGVAKGHDGGAPGNQHGEGDQGNGQGAQAAAPAPPPTDSPSPEPSVSPTPKPTKASHPKAGNPLA
jgi:eukaryotic-like serine/threonine-protein kinase